MPELQDSSSASPYLRLKGDYLAIVTLAFGEIIKNIINVLYIGLDETGLHFSLLEQHFTLGRGRFHDHQRPHGCRRRPEAFHLFFRRCPDPDHAVFSPEPDSQPVPAVPSWLSATTALPQRAIGLSVTRYKLLAFVISAVFAGMAGTLYAMNFSAVTASKFDFNTSILILVFVVLGGLGNIWGSIIAAALLTVLPELLRSMNDYRMLIYAILLIVMMIFNNSGAKKRLTEYFSAQKEKRTAKKAAGKGVN